MRYEIIKKLCCPFDKTDLNLRPITITEGQEILEGILQCPACLRNYPIVSGIPIMSPDEYRDFEMEQGTIDRWNAQLIEKGESPLLIESKD